VRFRYLTPCCDSPAEALLVIIWAASISPPS
jgi:hypothetical protein